MFMNVTLPDLRKIYIPENQPRNFIQGRSQQIHKQMLKQFRPLFIWETVNKNTPVSDRKT